MKMQGDSGREKNAERGEMKVTESKRRNSTREKRTWNKERSGKSENRMWKIKLITVTKKK